jgi:hypothetical protein
MFNHSKQTFKRSINHRPPKTTPPLPLISSEEYQLTLDMYFNHGFQEQTHHCLSKSVLYKLSKQLCKLYIFSIGLSSFLHVINTKKYTYTKVYKMITI